MIYLVSDTIKGVQGVSPISLEESKRLILSWPVVQFDTETTGLDCHCCSLTSMQFGYKDFQTGESDQIVVDCGSIDPKRYKDVIEHSVLIGHNLKFDIEFLYNHDIVPRKVYDTMVCEQLLYLGYHKGQVSFSLGDVLQRYTGIELDKSYQKVISYTGLTPEGIQYAAHDVIYLQDIRKAQMLIAQDRKCLGAFQLENRFVPVIAYLEWCGIKLDEGKWSAKMRTDRKNLDTYTKALNEYVLNSPLLNNESFVSSAQAGVNSLFDLEPKCSVLWSSPKQVNEVFKALGFDTKTLDKHTKEEKESVLENVIRLQKGIADDFVDIYFKYQEASTRVKTFGQGHLNQINPNTGRIHTVFRQLGTKTGRMASGASKTYNRDLAKLKKLNPLNVSYCNLQNLPRDHETRACFVAEPDNLFVSCDYSAEESRVQADVWSEQTLLDSFANGIDTHNLYAKMCFPDELKDVDVRDVKKKRPDLRDLAKKAEFAVGYGSDGSAIATNLGLPRDQARSMVSGILKSMPGMAAYKKKTAQFLRNHGYIVLHEKTGHRIYWPEWARWKALANSFDQQFWMDYRLYHKNTGDSVDKKVAWYKKQKNEWLERKVLNAPIQGGSAIVMKQAGADLFDWVIKHGYFNKIKFCVLVHDEMDVECPKELAEIFPKVMETIMEKAAAKFYTKLSIPATCEVSEYWVH